MDDRKSCVTPRRKGQVEQAGPAKPELAKFAAACSIYLLFAIYLYKPYFRNLHDLHNVVVANLAFAALGCYVVTRRWVWSFTGSFFAGALYGFGPYTLGLTRYHPTAGIMVAAIPWLLCPSAFGGFIFTRRWRRLRIPLAALPFLAVVLFFQITGHWRLFAVPTQVRLHPTDLIGFFAPFVAAQRATTAVLIGFYHVPLAALIVGSSMLLAARRLAIAALLIVGVTLSLCTPLLEVSPMIWLSVAVLCCSGLVGAGIQGLLLAGRADRGWLIFATAVMAALTIVTLLLPAMYPQAFSGLAPGYAGLFVQSGEMFILGVVTLAIIFVVARLGLRAVPLRLILLCSAMSLDIFLGARFIIDAMM